jgi:RNA polymerase sigma factor (TIGR02999 family)
MADQDITQLLLEWREGNDDALEQLTPLVYNELRRLAGQAFSGESAGHTLQPTVLVNEVFQRLIGKDIEWHDRNHFFALSSRLMRRILVDYANAKKAEKRGGDAIRVTYTEDRASFESANIAELLELDTALLELDTFDTRKAQALELHYFAGLTYKEVANVMEIAESTVHQDLRVAKAWLNSRLTA